MLAQSEADFPFISITNHIQKLEETICMISLLSPSSHPQ
jgi:hypothetical protein